MERYIRQFKESSFRNVNIGVDKKDKATIKKIEKFLDKLGLSYDSEGSDTNTYNINTGSDDFKQADKIEDFANSLGVYVDTETF